MARFDSTILSWDSNDKLEYVSTHAQPNANPDEAGWYILKLTWSGALLTNVERLRGAHNKRANLNWQ